MGAEVQVRVGLQDEVSKGMDRIKGKFRGLAEKLKVMFKKLSLKELLGVQAFSEIARGIGLIAGKVKLLAGALVNSAAASVMVAAGFESMQMTLKVLTKSTAEAKRLMGVMREWGRTTPLTTEDVVQSFVRLNAIGLSPNKKQMETLANVAVIFDREMADILDGLIGLNKRTLRQLGIDIDRTGKKAIIVSGDIRKEVEKDSASIRAALLELWEERFPNAMTEAARTTKSKIAIMKSNFTELRAVLGDRLKPMVNSVTDAFANLAFAIKQALSPDETKQIETAESKLKRLNKQIAEFRRLGIDKKVMRIGGKEDVIHLKMLQMEALELQRIIGLIKTKQGLDVGTGKVGGEQDVDPNKALQEEFVFLAEGKLGEYLHRLKKYKEALKIRKEAVKDIEKIDKQIEKAELRLQAVIEKDNIDKMKERWASLTEVAQTLGAGIGQSILTAFDSVKDAMKKILSTLVDYVTKQLFIAKLSAQAQAIIAGGVFNPGALTRLGAQMALITTLSTLAKGAIANLADGTRGPISRPTMALVGERGPETVMLPTGSQVVNNRGSNVQSSPTVNVYINGQKQIGSAVQKEVTNGVYKGMLALEQRGKISRGVVL